MAIKSTRWTAECGCIIDYTWDDAVPDDQRIHTAQASTPCVDHAALGSHDLRHRAVLDESRKREWGKAAILAAVPALGQTTIFPDGSTTVDWRVQVNVRWRVTFAGDGRALELNFPTATQNQKNQMQTAVDNRFGVGRIFIT